MADLATIPDVESRWRPLRGPQEPVNASTWLSDASADLRVRIRGLDDLIAADEDYADAVTSVVAMAVVRMFRGRDPQDPADYAGIFFTKAELDLLTGGGGATGTGAFQINVVASPGYRSGGLESFGWNV